MNKKLKGALIIALILVAFISGLTYLTLWQGTYFSSKSNSLETFDKLKAVETTGGKLSLSSNEINQIFDIYFKQGRKASSITVNGVHVDIDKGAMCLYVSARYRGLDLLLSSKGNLSYENNELVYLPNWFKIGKLPLPKNLVLSTLKKHSSDTLNVVKENITINKNVLPFSITSLKIGDSVLTFDVEKLIPDGLFNNAKAVINGSSNGSSNSGQNSSSTGSSSVKANGVSQSSNGNTNATGSTNSNSSKNNKQTTASKQAALSKLSGQLSNALSNTQTSGEAAVISRMQVAVSNMAANPSYNYGGDSAAVKAVYSKLSPEERNRVKAALFSNVDSRTIGELKSAFGI